MTDVNMYTNRNHAGQKLCMLRFTFIECPRALDCSLFIMTYTTRFLSKIVKKSNIHGISYLLRKDSSRAEKWVSRKQVKPTKKYFSCRIFWAGSLLISASILFSLIFLSAKKFLSNETFVMNTYEVTVGNIPFPAVTICPDSLIFEKFYEYQQKSHSKNFSEDEWVMKYFEVIFRFYFAFSLAAYQALDLLYDQNFLPSNFSTKSLVKTLEKYSQDYSFINDNQILWNGAYGVPLSRILTKWGLCFNFNLLPFESLLNNET